MRSSSRQHELNVGRVALAEAGLTVGQIEVPHAHETIVKAEISHIAQSTEESPPPLAQCSCVVQTNVFDVGKAQIRRLHCRRDGTDGDQRAAGKDVSLDEVDGSQVTCKGPLGDGDALQQHPPVGLEQGGTTLEECRDVLGTHGFDHLDRNDLVVFTCQVAVVLQQDRDSIREPRLRNTFGGEVILFLRYRRRRHAAAIYGYSMQGESTPTGTDLQHVIVGRQVQLLADAVELEDRRLFQRALGVWEDGRRIHHALIEEKPVELVAKIIVGGNVAAASVPRVASKCVIEMCRRSKESGHPWILGPVRLAVANEDSAQGDEIITGPFARHEPFRCTQIATDQDPSIDQGMVNVDRRRQPICRPTKTATFSTFDNVDEPVIEGFQRTQHKTPSNGVGGIRSR